jgi:hypothetical protein
MKLAYIGFLNWIKISQLQSLGIPKEVFFTSIIFLGVLGCYFIIRPIAFILISIKSERLLNYLLSGLSFVVIFLTIVLFIGEIELLTFQLFKLSLQAIAFFGFLLCIMHLFRSIRQRRKKI